MKADKVPPHVSTYNILVKIEANEVNIEGLVKVYAEMDRMKIEPNEVSCCILTTATAVARLYTAAEGYVEGVSFISQEGMHSSDPHFSTIQSKAANNGSLA
ncbi:hypothetical protein SAY86_016550 [Trapa natans]|nr:hypothetical protein SAY86_016550 [Trapa natans]